MKKIHTWTQDTQEYNYTRYNYVFKCALPTKRYDSHIVVLSLSPRRMPHAPLCWFLSSTPLRCFSWPSSWVKESESPRDGTYFSACKRAKKSVEQGHINVRERFFGVDWKTLATWFPDIACNYFRFPYLEDEVELNIDFSENICPPPFFPDHSLANPSLLKVHPGRWRIIFGSRGWTSIRAVAKENPAFSPSFSKRKGVDF